MRKNLLNSLRRYPVFTVKDIANALGKSREYAYTVAYRLKNAGELHQIEKGKYTLEDDPFVVASWIVWPSYISGWAALHYYKLTEQLPFTIHVVTTMKRNRKIISYGNARIEFINIRKEAFGGFNKITYMGVDIFIATPEKAIIDGITAKRISIGEAIEVVKAAKEKISRARLFSYAKASKGLAKRLKDGLND